jgi:hypothetical protein
VFGSVRDLINSSPSFGLSYVGTCVLSVFFIWEYAFYHWGIHEFKSRSLKTLWFFIILLGMYVGAFLYYVFVCEKKLTLRKYS